jgi:hypothetical protein
MVIIKSALSSGQTILQQIGKFLSAMIGEHICDTVDTDPCVDHIQRTYLFHQHSRYMAFLDLYISIL